MQGTESTDTPTSRQASQPPKNPMNTAEVIKYKPIVDRVVSSIIKKLPSNVTYEDLHSAGMEGLWVALCRRKDETNLEAYLSIRVRGAIFDELRAQDWLPRRLRETLEETGEAKVVRLDDLSESDQQIALRHEAPSEVAREVQILINVLDRLPPRERQILEEHYIKGVPFNKIAQQLGVSGPRVSQLHSRAMARVKELAA